MSLLIKTLNTRLVNCSHFPLIVAGPKIDASVLPADVTLTRRKINGSRVIVKNRRDYGNMCDHIARWPEAGLEEWGKHRLIYVLGGQINYQVGRYAVRRGVLFSHSSRDAATRWKNTTLSCRR